MLQGQFGISAGGKKDEVHVEDESESEACLTRTRAIGATSGPPGTHPGPWLQGQGCPGSTVREIAFTHLNRLCAYKMMEARAVWIGGKPFREAVSRGMKSQGFSSTSLTIIPEDKKLFDTGHQDVAYRHFLGWLGALLSEEIGVLFSPTDPANRLFPPQRVLDDVLALLNSDDLKDIWAEDETIGWVYQYFTPKELRDQVRKESAAPRNSYELAFRNQFFTPRYVVEFLTDNTLGRIWYEMRKGDTKLKDQCRYMVRRPSEIFLAEGQTPPEPTPNQDELSQEELLKQPVHIPHRPKKDPRELRILDPACGSGHFLAVLLRSAPHDLRGSLRRSRPWPRTQGRLPDTRGTAAGCASPDPGPQPARHRHRPAGIADCRPRPVAPLPASLPGDGAEAGSAQDHQVEHRLCRADAGREGDAR